MNPRPTLPAVLLALAAGTAAAADLTVTVTDGGGVALPWAVVALESTAGAGTGDWQPAPPVMRQQGTLFSPFVLTVRTGTTVSFPNHDGFRHHVYSFAKAKHFELRLYGEDETKTVTFERAGPVPLGCNIHDNMLSYVYVTDHPVHAVTDSLGTASFGGLGAGAWRLHLWHPDLAGEPPPPREATLAEGVRTAVAAELELRSVRRRQLPPREGGY